MRKCTKCEKKKPEDQFYWKVKNVRRRTECIECRKTYLRQHYRDNKTSYLANKDSYVSRSGGLRTLKYRLTEEEVAELIARYDGKCWMCKDREAIHFDHDHDCCPGSYTYGRCVRGVLCNRCNTGLGSLGDNMAGLERAMEYLTVTAMCGTIGE